ncbi:MAG: pyrroloquinoline quinone biosynthesis peptide chaperone PqqD [Methylotenera sp.]|nr:pyrroloquinoline quinone biosynthesis peptide chaperone PqqD [Methylotenera sp.]
MSGDFHFQPEDRPRLDSKYLLRWEKSQDAYVLLYPEGVIKLNATAAEILKRCTGETTAAGIAAELKTLFINNADIENSIYKFLEVTHGKGWIRR